MPIYRRAFLHLQGYQYRFTTRNIFQTPSSPTRFLLSKLSLTDDSTPDQNITTSLSLTLGSNEEPSKSLNVFDTPSSPTRFRLSKLSLIDDLGPEQNFTSSLRAIGDVVGPIDSRVTLSISYNNEIVTAGGEFKPSQVVNPPRVKVGGDRGTFYTLAMVDPDAPKPSNPILLEYLHWVVTDIPGTSDASFGNEIVRYESPQPSMGKHRVIFVLFQQKGAETVFPPGWRQDFNLRDFAEVYDITAVAAVYFNCRREEDLGGSRAIGDVVDPIANPVTLRISYNNKIVTAGGEFKPSQVVNRPRVEVGGDRGAFYTLAMVDPDAPSPSNPMLKEYLHWLVADIPATSDATFGMELTQYESPQPSMGMHRVVFVLMFQTKGKGTVYAPGWRQNVILRDFAEVFDSKPVAAVYFNCQREEDFGGSRVIIEDVVDPIDKPVTLSISYNNDLVTAGVEFKLSQIVNQPRVEIGGDRGTFYTLAMVDPDAPSPSNPMLKEYLHWLVTDIPGNSDASFGKEQICYESPRPFRGMHRIVFVLMSQQKGVQNVNLPGWRQNFNTRDFAEVFDVKPVAAVYFNCQREKDLGGSWL